MTVLKGTTKLLETGTRIKSNRGKTTEYQRFLIRSIGDIALLEESR